MENEKLPDVGNFGLKIFSLTFTENAGATSTSLADTGIIPCQSVYNCESPEMQDDGCGSGLGNISDFEPFVLTDDDMEVFADVRVQPSCHELSNCALPTRAVAATLSSNRSLPQYAAKAVTSMVALGLADDLSQQQRSLLNKRKYVRRSEKGKQPEDRRRVLKLTDFSPPAKDCCASHCVELELVDHIQSIRRYWVPMHHSRREQEIKAAMLAATSVKAAGPHRAACDRFLLQVGEVKMRVCFQAFCWAIGFGETTVRMYRKQAIATGSTEPCMRYIPLAPRGGEREKIASWLAAYAAVYGNAMPNSKFIEIAGGSRKLIFSKYLIDKFGGVEPQPVPDSSWFCKVWTELCGHIVIPKVQKFAKCGKCHSFKLALHKHMLWSQRVAIIADFSKHLTIQEKQRAVYLHRSNLSKTYPDQYLCLTMDGMTQTACLTPSFREPVHNIEEKSLQRRVIGVMMHGHKPARPCFYLDERFSHDADTTTTVLLHAIAAHEGPLPPVLFLQIDNTASENKNKIFLAIAATLQRLGLFKEVSARRCFASLCGC